MPITQGQFSFNTGRDITVKLVGPTGVGADLSNITMFDAKADYASQGVERVNRDQPCERRVGQHVFGGRERVV
jgi:hypothetical protein